MRGLRGATTVDADTREQIHERVVALLGEMFERNAIHHDDVISVIFTATDDLHSCFPAEAARAFGLGDVPLLCARELARHRAVARRAAPRLPRGRQLAAGRPTGMTAQRRAVVVGTGLIGGSIGLALRAQGWHVSGLDADEATTAAALERGVLDAVGLDATAELGFVATPVGQVARVAQQLLDAGVGVVSDVGSVKGPIVAVVDSPRFVGGHPMAGSEQVGVAGARADLFGGAAWVLTPGASTADEAVLALRAVLTSLGAEVLTLAPDDHDRLVALVSHVPHLTAATLMRIASQRADEHRALLRLAAGGFRDMTRIAAGHPGIWPDICVENRDAIVAALDALLAELHQVRDAVATADRASLYQRLDEARAARLNLPVSGDLPSALAEVRVTIPDRPGALSEVTTLAATLGVNIFDLEIAHSGEGERGVLVLLVEATAGEQLVQALGARGDAAALDRLP
jgi:prephenate dehydrogenase